MSIRVALCYLSRKKDQKFYIIPRCPFCYCKHKHAIPMEETLPWKSHEHGTKIKKSTVTSTNCVSKISHCILPQLYILEREHRDILLRNFDTRSRCKGIKKDGHRCARDVLNYKCVCTQHSNQLKRIIRERSEE